MGAALRSIWDLMATSPAHEASRERLSRRMEQPVHPVNEHSSRRLGKQLAKAVVNLMPALSSHQIHLLSLSIMILLAGEARQV